ncbi:MAG TPA: FeoA family protein, partial [Candidatus Kapabacteria bacterium]|nr:FeoA family protein [Candidatus Kapabacteria bacterium]
LVNFRNGDVVIVKRLSDHDPQMLSYFEKMKILPSTIIRIIDKAPFNGPITVFFNGESQIIGNEISKNIFVELYEEKEEN